MSVRGRSVTVVAGVIILVTLILAGAALGVSAIVSSRSSASPAAVVVPQTASPGTGQPTATTGSGGGVNGGSVPLAAPDQGPGQGSVDVRVSQQEIIVFKIGIRYYFQGGWFIITGPTTYIGTVRPPGFGGGEPKRTTTPQTTPSSTTPSATRTPSNTTPATPTPTTPPNTPSTTPPSPTPTSPAQPGTSPATPPTRPPAPSSAPPSSQSSSPQGVVVPNVVGDDATTAQQALSAAGFVVKVVGPATGTVLSQVPAANGTAPPGSTVVITLG